MKKNLKFIIIGAVMIALVVGYYYYLSNVRKTPKDEDNTTKASKITALLMLNLDEDYPPTPKEVAKLYADFTVALYTEEYTDEEFAKITHKMRGLFDDDLLATNPEENHRNTLKHEIKTRKNSGTVISSYSTSSSTNVDYYSVDGYKFARLKVTFTLKNGIDIGLTKERFLLRKDKDGHWKIFGWQLIEDDKDNE